MLQAGSRRYTAQKNRNEYFDLYKKLDFSIGIKMYIQRLGAYWFYVKNNTSEA